jgi:hypothetical protein
LPALLASIDPTGLLSIVRIVTERRLAETLAPAGCAQAATFARERVARAGG